MLALLWVSRVDAFRTAVDHFGMYHKVRVGFEIQEVLIYTVWNSILWLYLLEIWIIRWLVMHVKYLHCLFFSLVLYVVVINDISGSYIFVIRCGVCYAASCTDDNYNEAVACRRWCRQTDSVSSGHQSPGKSAIFLSASLYSRFCRWCYVTTTRCIGTAIWARCAGVSGNSLHNFACSSIFIFKILFYYFIIVYMR